MNKDIESKTFEIVRMLPPRKVEFYFSIGEVPITNSDNQLFSATFMSKETFKVPGTNYIQMATNREAFNQIIAIEAVPRPPSKFIEGLTRPKTPWDF
jgi:hypothetical protein